MIKNILKFKTDENTRNKILLWFILIIGICSIFLSFFKFNKNLKEPFIDKEKLAIENIYNTYNKLVQEGKIKPENQNTINNTEFNKDLDGDTDGDGITDYDELNIFKTSIYLKDSDGDGFSDFNEVEDGTDPNCKSGKVCSGLVEPKNNINAETEDQEAKNVNISKDLLTLDIKQAREELKKIVPENLKSTLDSLSDEQVKDLILTLYKENNTETETPETTKNDLNSKDYVLTLKSKLPEFTTQQISMLNNMDEPDIKEILLDANIADLDLLNKFQPGELKKAVLEN